MTSLSSSRRWATTDLRDSTTRASYRVPAPFSISLTATQGARRYRKTACVCTGGGRRAQAVRHESRLETGATVMAALRRLAALRAQSADRPKATRQTLPGSGRAVVIRALISVPLKARS